METTDHSDLQAKFRQQLSTNPQLREDLLPLRESDHDRARTRSEQFELVKQRFAGNNEIEVVGPIGTGGMGHVVRARIKKKGLDDQIFALKVPFVRHWDDPEELERFKKREQLPLPITHANVVRVFCEYDGEGVPGVLMEYIAAPSIAEFIGLRPNGRFQLRDGLETAVQMCHGVLAIHAAGVLHNDIKPDNFLYDERQGKVRVIDFGSASRLGEYSDLLPQPSSMKRAHTPAYVAPEVWSRSATASSYTRASDIYSLGVTICEMLTGQRPRESVEVASCVARIADGAKDDALGVNNLTAVLERMIRVAPEERPELAYVVRALQDSIDMLDETRPDPFVAAFNHELFHSRRGRRHLVLGVACTAGAAIIDGLGIADAPLINGVAGAKNLLALLIAAVCAGYFFMIQSVKLPTTSPENLARAVRATGQVKASLLAITALWSVLYLGLFAMRVLIANDQVLLLRILPVGLTLINNAASGFFFLLFMTMLLRTTTSREPRRSTFGFTRNVFVGALLIAVICIGLAVVEWIASSEAGSAVTIGGRTLSSTLSVFSGIAGAAAMFLFLSRLSSIHLGTPIWVRATLATYAAVQPIYPVFFEAAEGSQQAVLFFWTIGLVGKWLIWWSMLWALRNDRLTYYLHVIARQQRHAEEQWKAFQEPLKRLRGEKSDVELRDERPTRSSSVTRNL